MTWGELADQVASQLHECSNLDAFNLKIEALKKDVESKYKAPDQGWGWFWGLVAKAYEKQPSHLMKEAAAAAALNALAASAIAIIQAQGSK